MKTNLKTFPSRNREPLKKWILRIIDWGEALEKELREDYENTVIRMNEAFRKEEGAEAMACSGRIRLIKEILADKEEKKCHI